MNQPMIQTWAQYTHLDKLYGYLPGMRDAMPAVFGMDPPSYAELRARFDERARRTAQQLLTDPAFAVQVDALPFEPDETVLAVGDSITDDWQSWVEILRHLLELRRPDHRVSVVNGGLSTHTTAMVLRRWPATLTQHRPSWILCALGGNDVTRVGQEPTKAQVSLPESVANLRQMRRIAAASTDASWVWITPAPVREDRVAEFPAFRYGQSSWRTATSPPWPLRSGSSKTRSSTSSPRSAFQRNPICKALTGYTSRSPVKPPSSPRSSAVSRPADLAPSRAAGAPQEAPRAGASDGPTVGQPTRRGDGMAASRRSVRLVGRRFRH